MPPALPGWKVSSRLLYEPLAEPYHIREDRAFVYVCCREALVAVLDAHVATPEIINVAVRAHMHRTAEEARR